jgi:hypothetical protein
MIRPVAMRLVRARAAMLSCVTLIRGILVEIEILLSEAQMPYEDFELEIGSYLPGGGGPQQYYGRVVKSPGGEAPRS